jgi:signal transduction histidine kinase
MNLNSIRWRLPFSYAAIALLAALALGSVMLLVLNDYYAGQECAYLTNNAIGLGPIVETLLTEKVPGQTLQDRVTGLAFLSQTQIRVLDADGKVIVDSGIPDSSKMIGVSGAPVGDFIFSVPANPPGADGTPVAVFEKAVPVFEQPPAGTAQAMPMQEEFTPGKAGMVISVNASPYGYAFIGKAEVPVKHCTSRVVSQPLAGSLGILEVSGGPAYGADILASVVLAWLVASVFAITLAALAGWFASRQVTRPVLALTAATLLMEGGHLSTRVELPNEKQQEFTALAHSFNNMAQRVEDTVSTLRAFVSDAAHELNTPLTALKTNLELAANEPDADQKSIFLARAIEQNRRLELLTDGLLDLSRLEAAPSAPHLDLLDLRQLAAETGERFASRAEQAERSFGLDLPAGEIVLPGNALQLQRALDNLLENALKFTPPGGAISLQLEQKDGQVTLTVSDTGIGILPEDLPHIFERFHRGRNSAEFPGNGLGLAIVKAIVSAHGGQVSVESAGREQGSRFSIVLPKA